MSNISGSHPPIHSVTIILYETKTNEGGFYYVMLNQCVKHVNIVKRVIKEIKKKEYMSIKRAELILSCL